MTRLERMLMRFNRLLNIIETCINTTSEKVVWVVK